MVNFNPNAGTVPDVDTNYYHEDSLGSARMMASVDGYPVWKGTYLPFGAEWNPQMTVGNYKFGGMEQDAESGLGHTQFRQYNSTLGRWLTPDPVGGDIMNPQSLNRYAYALNNPTTLVDPLGLTSISGCQAGVICVDVWGNGSDSGTSLGNDILWDLASEGGGATCNGGFQCGASTIFNGPWNPCSRLDGGDPRSSTCSEYKQSLGGASAPKPAPPAVKPPSKPLSALSNIFQATLNSFESANGCDRLLFGTFANDLNPIPSGPSLADTIKPAADFSSAVLFNKALGYAASQSNILGGTGLLYPFKSGAFRGLMDLSKTFEDIVPEASLVYATADALYTSGTAARNGECQ